jgi:Ca-activated chloride channel family protein
MKRASWLVVLALLFAGPAWAQAITTDLMVIQDGEGDEVPIALAAATVDVETVAGLAQTKLELTFHNPNARVLEGELAFPLQAGQEVVGFALDIEGKMRPAVPVEKDRGRAVFEEIERRGVDPGLLERTQGNFFRLRVYPIPANGTRRVRIVIAEALARDGDRHRLRLPLAFARGLGAVALRVHDGARDHADAGRGLTLARDGRDLVATLSPRHLASASGLVLRWPVRTGDDVQVQRANGEAFFVAQVPLAGGEAPRPLPRRVGLLWDASGSGLQRDRGLELAVLDGYFRALGDADVRLVVLRDRGEAPRDFRVARGDWTALREALKATVFDGATDLGDWTPQADVDEYVLISDGLGNYGGDRVPTLAPTQRLYTLNSAGASADATRLAAVALARGGRPVEVNSPNDVDAAVAQLVMDAPRLVALDGIGAQDLVADSPYPRGGMLLVAGRLTHPGATVTLTVRDGNGTRRIVLPVSDAQARDGDLVARTWAGLRVRELGVDPEGNRTAIRVLGLRHGIATSETSLIVLETVEDYVHYSIEPPPELREAYAAQRRERDDELAGERAEHLADIVRRFQEKQAWWERDFPKRRPEPAKRAPGNLSRSREGALMAGASAPAPAPAAEAVFADEGDADLETIMVTGTRIDPSELGAATIALAPWAPDTPVARRLRAAPTAQLYAIYLDERTANARSSAFYLDVADLLLQRGERDLALRVLSNLAELQIESRHVLRVLGYRLMQAGDPAQAVRVFERVLDMAEEEPQSWRDLGLALDAAGQPQRAVDALHEVVRRSWSDRFAGIDMIALAELNAIVARAPAKVDTRAIDPRLLRNLPVGLRTVLTWDADSTDMDLWVTQPDGERCSYSHELTAIGMRFEDDFTGGYGPEECALRRAPPGRYKVEVHFYGSAAQVVTGATTVQLWLSTGFGTPQQKDEKVTLRLEGKDERVLVGEFEVH